MTDKHVMIDIDQDYTTTETEENLEKSEKLDKHHNNIIDETKLDNNISHDIRELLEIEIDKIDKKQNKLNNLNNLNKQNKQNKQNIKDIKDIKTDNNDHNSIISFDTLNTLNNLEYDEMHVQNETDLDTILSKTLQLQKNQLKSKFFNKKIIERLKINLENEIDDASMWRFTWAKIATAMFCISEVLMIIQTALSFTAASYQIILISYLAGVIGVIAIGLNRFGAYSKNQSTEKTNQLNKLLKTIGIDNSLPDLMDYTDKKDKNDK